MRISPSQWQVVDPLLAHAIDLTETERAAWLMDLERSRPEISPLLRRLLAADERAERQRILDTFAVDRPHLTHRESCWQADQLIGRYCLRSLVGQGGMGEVWLARQAEGGIQRSVALKLPILTGSANLSHERFRRERDILARLQHPHIATLFDAGLALLPDGAEQPYLAMEYVEGTSLLQHAEDHALSLRDRLELFRQVLAAVGHAHRQLVIHRDIKPSNILVTGEGVAKLLDFGIAKLMEDAAATEVADDLTRVGGRLLTLRYASPEQAFGEILSTATDVYALGVVLHELLTGKSPYRRVREQGVLRITDLQGPDFAPPSSLAPRSGLAGDLDAILLKALRREPEDRYASVDQLDDDLRRYLEQLPVLARRGDRRYRLGRFISRHRLPLAATAATLISLAIGLAMSLQQRHEALVAKARAERHFASVRDLSETFIFDIENELRGVSGTLPARRKLAETGARYLDQLSTEADKDPALAADVAGGYIRIGQVLGGVGSQGNLGEWDAALVAFEKAARLLGAISPRGETESRVAEDRLRLHIELSNLYAMRRDPRWQAEDLKAIAERRDLVWRRGNAAEERISLATMLVSYAYKLSYLDASARPDSALLQEGLGVLDGLDQEVRDAGTRAILAGGYSKAAELLTLPGHSRADAGEALAAARHALAILDPLKKAAPENSGFGMQASLAHGAAITALLILNRSTEAEREMNGLLQDMAQMHERDRRNIDIAANYWAALAVGAETAYRAGQPDLASRRAARSWTIWPTLPDSVKQGVTLEPYRLKGEYFGGLGLLAAGDAVAACPHLRKLPQKDDGFPGLPAALARCQAMFTADN